MVTCSYDYMSTDWNRMSFLLYAFIGNYVIPMMILMYFYSQIVKAVIENEDNVKKAVGKMNIKYVSCLIFLI